MGKGDKKTKKGKRIAGTYGVHRPRTAKNKVVAAPKAKKKITTKKTSPKKVTKKEEVKEEVVTAAAPVKEKATAKKTTPKKTTSKSKGDNLTKIEGIGPKVMEVLGEAGIDSFEKLSKSKPDAIAEILITANSRYKMFDPTTWPQQAELAAADKWDELKELQEKLDGGKSK